MEFLKSLNTNSLLYVTGTWKSTRSLQNFSDCAYEHYINTVYTLQLCHISTNDIGSYKLHLRYADNGNVRSINGTIRLHINRKILIFCVPGFCKNGKSFYVLFRFRGFFFAFLFTLRSFIFFKSLHFLCFLSSAKCN